MLSVKYCVVFCVAVGVSRAAVILVRTAAYFIFLLRKKIFNISAHILLKIIIWTHI